MAFLPAEACCFTVCEIDMFLDSGRVNEAYEHALDVERTVAFTQSLAWYQCFLDVLQVIQN